MQHNLHIILPDNRGYIDPKECQGTFTIAVLDIQKRPVSALSTNNFLLYWEGDFIEDLDLAEHIDGVYNIQFPVEPKHVLGLKQEQERPFEVMLTVKKDGRYSNTLLIPLT